MHQVKKRLFASKTITKTINVTNGQYILIKIIRYSFQLYEQNVECSMLGPSESAALKRFIQMQTHG